MKIHHIGYAVRDIQKGIGLFEVLGFEKSGDTLKDLNRKVSLQLMKNNDLIVELVAPTGKESPLYSFIERGGSAPYHFCFETDDIEKEIVRLRKQKYTLIESIKPAKLFGLSKVAFLFNPHIGLIEIIEIR